MTTQPSLIHGVDVDILLLNRTPLADGGKTIYDDDFREPVQQASHETKITVKGQPKWGTREELGASEIGAEATAAGYVLFRFIDLESHLSGPVVLKQNDRLTKIGKLATDVYIVSFRPEGHFDALGGATLLKAFFADRFPSRQEA